MGSIRSIRSIRSICSIRSKLQIITLLALISACTNSDLASEPNNKWMFAHMSSEGHISNETTVIMPVTQDIIAFTDSPYQKHAEISGLEFISLLGDVRPTATRRHLNKSRNAVLSWLDGDQTREIRLVITGAKVDRQGKSITYTAESIDALSGVQALVSPHLYIDRYYKKKDPRSKKYQYPMQTSSRELYTLKNRRPSPPKE